MLLRKIKEYGEVQLYLESLEHIKRNIKNKQLQIQQLQEQTESITYTLKQDFVRGGKLHGGFADSVSKIVDLQFAINTDIYQLVTTIKDITIRIDNMFCDYPDLANLLTLRYVNGLGWETVCEELHCSSATVYRLHTQALKQFKNYMP